ncbi:hypothetical protein Bbelb_052310 [Branchiostoma belcheri]|nr:hypothetical protein Bbelb_052310 [Branchiostoma belcheri]
MAVCVNMTIIDKEAKTNNSPQTMRCDEARSARTEALQSTSRFQCVSESISAGTTQAEIHHYCNDNEEVLHHQNASAAPPPVPVYDDNDGTSLRSEDPADEEVLHHKYASAAPPPVPVYDDNDGTPAQETARHSTGTGAAEQTTSQIDDTESGDEDVPYGIAAANTVYQAISENNGHFSGNPEPNYGAANDIETDRNPARNTLYEQQSRCILHGRGPTAEH